MTNGEWGQPWQPSALCSELPTVANIQHGVTGADAPALGQAVSSEGRTVQSHKRKGAGHEGELKIFRFGCPCETIAVAVAEPDGEVRSLGTIPNSFISCASSASITWEFNASRWRPDFSSHLFASVKLELVKKIVYIAGEASILNSTRVIPVGELALGQSSLHAEREANSRAPQ